jgi:hypothetical protein
MLVGIGEKIMSAFMKFIGSRRSLAMIVSLIILAGLAVFVAQKQSTPFHTGSAVDDIWNYIHMDAVSDRFSGRILSIHKSTRWTADLTTIKSETSFTWNKKSFAVHTTKYSYANGFVTHLDSGWKIEWPF